MTDLIERLRMQGMDTDMQDTAREAANEIERLWAEVERLRAAIRKYLSHQLSHQESYVVLRAALDEQVAQ